MRLVVEHERCAVWVGDCLGLDLPEGCVDAVVTDPPAGIGFMGRAWDESRGGMLAWSAWLAERLAVAFRALKPGGHALVWALPRTSHWTALAVEDAGFEVRDVHHHLFATGFPKSLTSASADIPAGAGTALKPAVEHWILARKPFRGSVEKCHAEYGTATLNIEACRVGTEKVGWNSEGNARASGTTFDDKTCGLNSGFSRERVGRWPAHLSLEHADACPAGMEFGGEGYDCVLGCPVRLLDEQSGIVGSNGGDVADGKGTVGFKGDARKKGRAVARSRDGGASRFFYCPKPARSEKDLGLDHLEPLTGGQATGRDDAHVGTGNPRAGANRRGGARNTHPTPKSVALMRWLVRLITPPGGVVLDPFAGSGTTILAALAEGCEVLACELATDPRYEQILVGRVEHALAPSRPGV
jgi:DNA methylase